MNTYKLQMMVALALGWLGLFSVGAVASIVGPGQPAPTRISPVAVNPLSQHLNGSMTSFKARDFNRAAVELGVAADILELEAKQAPADSGRDLSASAAELRQLALRIDQGGPIATTQPLEQAGGRAYWAEAGFYYQQAVQSWADRSSGPASREIKVAADDLEQGVTFTGRDVDLVTKLDLRKARSWADRIEGSPGWTRVATGGPLVDLGRQIDRFGRSLDTKGYTGVRDDSRICYWLPGDDVLAPGEPGMNPIPLTLFSFGCTSP
jgi:hypothetical protein